MLADSHLHCQHDAVGCRVPQPAVECVELVCCDTAAESAPLLKHQKEPAADGVPQGRRQQHCQRHTAKVVTRADFGSTHASCMYMPLTDADISQHITTRGGLLVAYSHNSTKEAGNMRCLATAALHTL
jgi:hypothetical protein